MRTLRGIFPMLIPRSQPLQYLRSRAYPCECMLSTESFDDFKFLASVVQSDSREGPVPDAPLPP
jgi:hypothetical protein